MSTATLRPEAAREAVLTTFELDSLPDGAYSPATSPIDLAASGLLPAYVNLIAQNFLGTVGATGNVHVYVLWSDDSADIIQHSSPVRNGERAMSVDMNATAPVNRVALIPVQARFLSVSFLNQSGSSLAANAGDAFVRKVNVDNT